MEIARSATREIATAANVVVTAPGHRQSRVATYRRTNTATPVAALTRSHAVWRASIGQSARPLGSRSATTATTTVIATMPMITMSNEVSWLPPAVPR